ncbi:AAA family ATPase [Flavobacterium sp. RNTU_13]|uniref:AAA family ATPase n=1 Tax=Flavobacterium sp. RNTU_13 TaxID=3375145 RepID=UPI0039867D01
MDKILNFLTKSLVDEAAAVIDSGGFTENQERSKYEVDISGRQYPYKLLVNEAAKIAGGDLTHGDFTSPVNRKEFEELTGYNITSIDVELEYDNFKKLLEYFVSHLEWIENKVKVENGYSVYIEKHISSQNFKMTGQGYHGAGIQKQIENWDSYTTGRICINIQGNFGSYTSVKCYLNWQHTGINILAKWKDGKVIGLYQDEFIWWEKPTRRINSGKEYTLDELNLFGGDLITNELEDFFRTFEERHKLHIRNQIKAKQMERVHKIKELLNYKKQIILQGPPGTGKTRVAKLIAESMLGFDEKVEIEIFKNALKSTKKFPATNNNNPIIVDSFTEDTIHFKETASVNSYSFSLKELYDCYLSEDYLKDNFVQYPQYAKRCLVLHILKTYKNSTRHEQLKIIQFHPSYTYEDFVRGIVSRPNENGDNIVFTEENKILGKFIEKALSNFNDLKKGITELSLEKWLEEQFEKFIIYTSEKLEKGENIELTESVFIVDLDEDAFRYKGRDGWNKKGNRMLFKDIKQAYLDENFERQDIKHNQNLSGLAKWHASYYIRVLDMFKTYLKEKNLIFKLNNFNTEKSKKYVLIIDEINRANLSSVLGELIYALEYRGKAVESMYAVNGDNKLILPPNLYIIGTMNTADRSVGHIDYAIRRRFAFVNVPAENLKLTQGLETFDAALFDAVTALFDTNLSPEFDKKDVQLGHSYFIDKSREKDGVTIAIRLEYEIKPILREYVRDGVLTGESIKEKIEALTVSV